MSNNAISQLSAGGIISVLAAYGSGLMRFVEQERILDDQRS
jgi:hypothetical protein